jgi:hypothetical protein
MDEERAGVVVEPLNRKISRELDEGGRMQVVQMG